MKRVILNKETRAKLREKYPAKHTEIKENIRIRAIEDEVKENVLDYSMSVILDRAIPRLQDGLKPVQRRILYAMKDVSYKRKSARLVGEVLGKYHAHGDKSVYDAMVRLIQPFKMYVPYMVGQGNYGSLDADDAVAAYRYCLTGDAIIKTKTYGDISYDELAKMYNLTEPYTNVDIDIEVKSMNGAINKSSKLFHSGFHPTMELTLRNGMKIRGTYNHPVLTVVNAKSLQWKTLDTITKNDVIVIDSENSSIENGSLHKNMDSVGVKNIKDTGKIEAVYSIRVDSKCHSYVSNGIISHNTEVDKDEISELIFRKYNQLGLIYKDNYDNTMKEPKCLAPPIPMLLVNGAIGIAVGMATYIPTHNPYEVINAYEAYIKCELKNDNIRKYLKAPDPVIPCYVIDRDGIDRAYKTGSGKYHCMSYYHVEDDTRGKKKIVFTSVLPNRYKDNDIRSLVDKCRDQRNPLSQMVADIADESSKEGIRIVVVIKKDIKVEDAIEALIAARFCYDSFTISMRVIDEGRPMKIGIVEMMKRFHKANRASSERHLEALKGKKEERIHILDGLELAITNYDGVISIIRKSKDKESSIEALVKKYKIDEKQAAAILDTKLVSLVNKGDSIKEERKILKAEVKEINLNLKDIDGYIINIIKELKVALKPYSKRRCKIIKEIPKTPL